MMIVLDEIVRTQGNLRSGVFVRSVQQLAIRPENRRNIMGLRFHRSREIPSTAKPCCRRFGGPNSDFAQKVRLPRIPAHTYYIADHKVNRINELLPWNVADKLKPAAAPTPTV
ncbi:hypothetical protein [Caballeronia calidae]|uniref:hypothetical protein n=1 Tax=Caballeronia calidae TaxID=1777139 RepID=UPI0035B52F64